MSTQDALSFLEGVIEEVLEGSSQQELLDLIDELDLEPLFINEELVSKLQDADETLRSNLKKLKRQRQIFQQLDLIDRERKPLLDALIEERQTDSRMRNDEFITDLREEIKPFNDKWNELAKKKKFDTSEELEDKIQGDLAKFNMVRRKLKKEDREMSDFSKNELIDELFEHFGSKSVDTEDLLLIVKLSGANNIEELQVLRE